MFKFLESNFLKISRVSENHFIPYDCRDVPWRVSTCFLPITMIFPISVIPLPAVGSQYGFVCNYLIDIVLHGCEFRSAGERIRVRHIHNDHAAAPDAVVWRGHHAVGDAVGGTVALCDFQFLPLHQMEETPAHSCGVFGRLVFCRSVCVGGNRYTPQASTWSSTYNSKRLLPDNQ